MMSSNESQLTWMVTYDEQDCYHVDSFLYKKIIALSTQDKTTALEFFYGKHLEALIYNQRKHQYFLECYGNNITWAVEHKPLERHPDEDIDLDDIKDFRFQKEKYKLLQEQMVRLFKDKYTHWQKQPLHAST